GRSVDSHGCLLFTESAWDHHFRTFRDEVREMPPGWSFAQTDEAESVLALHAGKPALLMIAGRQIVTADGLEVLALGTDREFADGEETRAALEAVRDSGALAVLPWGFGKWWFRRGRLVREILADSGNGAFFLGDNGGRPRLSVTPRVLREGRRRGFRVLPGSDPLPFARQVSTVGSRGFAFDCRLDPARPARSIRQALGDRACGLESFGHGDGIAAFIRDQLAMQWVKRQRTS
ncbi:MAG: hypothetical protein ACE5F8_08825, partial [Woeseiaceae bacterium]